MPGQGCQLYAQAYPGSFIFLLGVDESATLGSENDILRSRIEADKNLFEEPTYTKENISSKYPGFSEANAFIITNAYGKVPNCEYHDRMGEPIWLEHFVDQMLDGLVPEFVEIDLDKVPKSTELRKTFPETWIFKDFEMGDRGKMLLDTKCVVPNAISTFIISGFAVHPEHGLALATPRKITVFKDFFLETFIPSSIKWHEVIKVDVSVFNYVSPKKTIQVEITMTGGHDEFEFVEDPNGICDFTASKNQDKNVKSILVLAGKHGATFFLIRAKQVGMIKIEIKASTEGFIEKVERFVEVEQIGLREIRTMSQIINLTKKTHFLHTFHISLPDREGFIADSVVISALVETDSIGPELASIGKLM